MTHYQKGVRRKIGKRNYCMTYKVMDLKFTGDRWQPQRVKLSLRDQTDIYWSEVHMGVYDEERAASIYQKFLKRDIDELLMENLL